MVTRHPYRSWAVGTLLVLVGRVSMLAVPALVVFAIQSGAVFGSNFGIVMVAMLLGGLPIMFVIGPFMVRLGKRIGQPDPAVLLEKDQRPPIVFLRPFDEDGRDRTQHDLVDDDDFGYIGNLFNNQYVQILRMYVKGYFGLEDLTLEEELADAFRPYGPIVAVGKPGERFQTSGAARMYLSDEDWQSAVESLLERAAIVIWQAGTSAGTWWELQTIVRLVDPLKVLLVVPSPVKRANRYEQLWHHANPVLPRGLPRQWHDFNLITFDAEWNPQGHSFVYLEPVARFFVSSGLEVPASLPAFLARHAALLNQDAGLPVTLNLRAGIMAATVWVAPLGALGIYLAAIAADKSAQEAADLRDDCTRKATEIREFLADPTDTDESAEYWADKIERMRAALDEPNALFCMTIDEATQAREQFPAIVARDVTDRYPAWEANVRSNTETADAVTHALTRSGDRNLLLQWQQRSTELVREAMESLVSYELVILHEPEDFDEFVTNGTERELVRAWSRSFADGVAPNLAVRSSDELSEEELRWVHKTVKLEAYVVHARYGEADVAGLKGWHSVPEMVVGTADLAGCKDGEAERVVPAEISIEAPAQIGDHEFVLMRSRHAYDLGERLGSELARTARECFGLEGAPETTGRSR